jgi:hypothetical protein
MIVRSIEEHKEIDELSPRLATLDYADADNEAESPGKDLSKEYISNQLAKPRRSPLMNDSKITNEISDEEFL